MNGSKQNTSNRRNRNRTHFCIASHRHRYSLSKWNTMDERPGRRLRRFLNNKS
jgi:hypothetical protein